MQTVVIATDDKETLIKCVLLKVTKKAYKIRNLDNKLIYLPKKNVEIVSNERGVVEILIPQWLVELKDLL